jgi:hypothetical protein
MVIIIISWQTNLQENQKMENNNNRVNPLYSEEKTHCSPPHHYITLYVFPLKTMYITPTQHITSFSHTLPPPNFQYTI